MEEESLSLPLTRVPSVEPEPPIQFVFINEREKRENPSARSNYGLKVRSHVGKRVYIERRRAFARKNIVLPKSNRQLLSKATDSQRDPEPDATESMPSASSNQLATNDAADEVDLDEPQPASSSCSADDLEELGSSDLSDKPDVRRTPPPKSPRRSNKLSASKQTTQQAPCQRDCTKTIVRMQASQINQVMLYLKSKHNSPTSILGAAKTDPFRSYPLDADTYEEGLLAYCKHFI